MSSSCALQHSGVPRRGGRLVETAGAPSWERASDVHSLFFSLVLETAMKTTTHWISVAFLCGAGLVCADAVAQDTEASSGPPRQFALVESAEYTHNTWYKFWKFPYQPSDWTQPHDFSRGTTYFRFEITSLQQETMLQFCYFQDRHVSEKHACSPGWTFAQPGVYYRRQDNRTLWQRTAIDWTRELLDFMLIDNAGQGAGRARVRVSLFVVASGEQFDPPAEWECPSDWNCRGQSGGGSGGGASSGGASSGGASSGGSSSGGAGTGGSDASGGSTASGGAASGGAASGGSDASGGTGGSGTPATGGAASGGADGGATGGLGGASGEPRPNPVGTGGTADGNPNNAPSTASDLASGCSVVGAGTVGSLAGAWALAGGGALLGWRRRRQRQTARR
jgi:MYXO-CTERM domain-containing protein